MSNSLLFGVKTSSTGVETNEPYAIDSTSCFPTIGIEHYKIHRGLAFRTYFTASAAANASGMFAFNTGSGTSHFRMLSVASAGPGLTIRLLANPYTGTLSASAAWKLCNQKRTYEGNIRTLTASAYSTSGSTILDQHFIPGASGQGGSKSGGGTGADEEFELLPNTTYAIWYNSTSADNAFNIRCFYYDEAETPR